MSKRSNLTNKSLSGLNGLVAAVALTATGWAGAETPLAAIAFSDIGARATAGYQGDALGVTATAEGARLRCGFQKLEGHATAQGLWLESTAAGGGRLRLVATVVGREVLECGSPLPLWNAPASTESGRGQPHSKTLPRWSPSFSVLDDEALATTGAVSVKNKLVRFTRPSLTEEYSVSVDGLRQDFVVTQRPAGEGALRVELALSGARAEATAYGVKFTFEGSGRVLAYSRLRVEDATGRELTARLEVLSTDRLAVSVAHANAIYPVRIDPTFSDAQWVSINPGIPGANGPVSAIVVDGSGNVYAGGDFTFIGTVPANSIAKWDGSAWSALGAGIRPPFNQSAAYVVALAASGTNLYVGGSFTTSGVSATNIAKWDGSTWSALDSGIDNIVKALAVSGTDLYAAGYFATAGGVPATNIAKWNGSSWSALGSGMNDGVNALAVSGTDLYAGGYFTTAGGVPATNIAKWNGSSWSALGSGMNGGVNALAVSGTDLYAGGGFATAGGVPATNIAKWNGSTWSALGSGFNNGLYPPFVLALAVSGTNLYAGGYFTNAGGVSANYIAKWDGSAWSALGSGMGSGSGVSALAVSGTNLYAAGYFATVGGVPVNNIAAWNGSAWSALSSGMTGPNGEVHALAASGSDLYVGGQFNNADGAMANNIAKWDGAAWSPLGLGIGGGSYPYVSALAVCGTNLYAGGRFNTAGGVPVASIAKWDGSAWSALGAGIRPFNQSDAQVVALAASGTNLYVGGSFIVGGAFTTSGVSAANIAKWDGSTWSALDSGIDNGVAALAVSGTDLYAAGYFTTAGGVPATNIAKWNGSSWSALGSGMNGGVNALAVSGTDLYAGGGFATAGGVPATNIAKWNGAAWSPLGLGIGGGSYPYVSALAVCGTNLYVGGYFTTAGGVPANCIAKWDGSGWSALGSGMSTPGTYVDTLLADAGRYLFVGGQFFLAGTNPSPYVAEARLQDPMILQQPTNQAVLTGSRVEFTVAAAGSATLFYQWFFNATNPASSVSPNCCLELTNVQHGQGGTYTVVITNTRGAVTSAPAVLTVLDSGRPSIFMDPSSQAAPIGGVVDFSVAVNGLPPLSYYWLFNGTNVQGTGTMLHLADVQLAQAGAYSVIVSNVYGAVTSAPAWLTVTGVPPVIVSSPTSLSLRMGDTATFSVAASGTLPLGYQWYFGTSALFGATGSAVQLKTIQPGQAGVYTVVVTNAYGAATSAPAMLEVLPAVAVTAASEAALRSAMAQGGYMTFACDGTITLASTITNTLDTVLDATGHQITISGGDAVRVFYVQSNVTLVLNHLTIAHGRSTNVVGIFNGNGAGLFNDNGTVSATNTTFDSNAAVGADGQFWLPASAGGNAAGGALANLGVMNLANCSFTNNSVVGGAGSEGDNLAVGNPTGGAGGNGAGGAVWNSGLLTSIGCTFAGNRAQGGVGGFGGAPQVNPGRRGGAGGDGGSGSGGALFNDRVSILVNCTFVANTGAGAPGGLGGSNPAFPYADGPDGLPGLGFGAISDAYGQCYLTNCTIAFNSGTSSSYPSCGGIGTSGAAMLNTLLADNEPGGNCLGRITDLGHNLSSDNTCAFTSVGSKNNTDPKLGPLADNGGPTLTMALLPGSPAIDAGNTSLAPATDQRGFPRPAGLAADIGAFEYGSVMPTLAVSRSGATGLSILASGNANQPCRLLMSTDLANWVPIASTQIGSNGTVLFYGALAPGGACRFYRLVMP